jgi:hypothetical protein
MYVWVVPFVESCSCKGSFPNLVTDMDGSLGENREVELKNIQGLVKKISDSAVLVRSRLVRSGCLLQWE